jgi:hypothetical protein
MYLSLRRVHSTISDIRHVTFVEFIPVHPGSTPGTSTVELVGNYLDFLLL